MQFWTNFHEIHMVGAIPHMAETVFCFVFFLENNRPNRTTDRGKCVPKIGFWLSFSQYRIIWGNNFKTAFGTPFSIEKITFIFVVGHAIRWKMVMPSKNYFSQLFCKILYFWKNCYMKTSFLTKKFILIFVVRHPLPFKMVMSSHKWFFTIFST